MKFNYDLTNACDTCNSQKPTRNVENLDPRHYEIINYLCKVCDNSYETIPKILKKNTNKFGTGDVLKRFRNKNGHLKIVIMGDNNDSV